MARVIVAAFVATFIAAVAAIVGVPVLAQDTTPAQAQTAPFDTPPAPRQRATPAPLHPDSSGRISKADWLAAGRHERGFDMMDTDHDGYLTAEELKIGRAKMRAMREARANGTGAPPPPQ